MLNISTEKESCALCQTVGYLTKNGSHSYCSNCFDKIKNRQIRSKAITIDRSKLFDLRSIAIISKNTFVYFALQMDGYFKKDQTGDAAMFCARWGLTKEELMMALARLSTMGCASWQLEKINLSFSEKKANDKLPLEDINGTPIVIDFKKAKELVSMKIITERALLYFFLLLNSDSLDFTLEDLTKRTSISVNKLAQYLGGFSKKGILNIDFERFEARVYDYQDKIEAIENAFKC